MLAYQLNKIPGNTASASEMDSAYFVVTILAGLIGGAAMGFIRRQ